jgi:DNA invertase Pin-like site-specific DNA recombinase
MTTAYPYLRFSSTRQGRGDSTRRQSSWHEEVAKQEGWRLDYSLRLEDKGKSAYHGDHLKADLGRFLASINAGQVKPGSVLLFEEMDRLRAFGKNEKSGLFSAIFVIFSERSKPSRSEQILPSVRGHSHSGRPRAD